MFELYLYIFLKKDESQIYARNLRNNQEIALGEKERVKKIVSDEDFHEFMKYYISTCPDDYFERIAADIWREIGGKEVLSFGDLTLLKKPAWPGNVRQLKNVLQRYALLKCYGISLAKILDEEFCSAPLNYFESGCATTPMTGEPERGAKEISRYIGSFCERPRHYAASPEWELICSELARNDGNRSVTAQKLGISRGCLNYQIKKHSCARN